MIQTQIRLDRHESERYHTLLLAKASPALCHLGLAEATQKPFYLGGSQGFNQLLPTYHFQSICGQRGPPAEMGICITPVLDAGGQLAPAPRFGLLLSAPSAPSSGVAAQEVHTTLLLLLPQPCPAG